MKVSNEKAVFELACVLSDLYDANPDVGMGLFFSSFIEQATRKLGLSKNDVNVEVVNAMRNGEKRY